MGNKVNILSMISLKLSKLAKSLCIKDQVNECLNAKISIRSLTTNEILFWSKPMARWKYIPDWKFSKYAQWKFALLWKKKSSLKRILTWFCINFYLLHKILSKIYNLHKRVSNLFVCVFWGVWEHDWWGGGSSGTCCWNGSQNQPPGITMTPYIHCKNWYRHGSYFQTFCENSSNFINLSPKFQKFTWKFKNFGK